MGAIGVTYHFHTNDVLEENSPGAHLQLRKSNQPKERAHGGQKR